jgi:geranylgeranyl diphosphate synthase type II
MKPSEFSQAQSWIADAAKRQLTELSWHPELLENALYALRGGKAVRPALMFWIAKQWNEAHPRETLKLAALALEMMHAYSLVHDDLPCMDNDDFRRGRPTLHRLMGEAPALLLGDSLLCGGFEILSGNDFNATQSQLLVRELSLAGSASQLVGGQFDDLRFEKQSTAEISLLHDIHRRKTGALFGAAAAMTAIALERSGYGKEEIKKLRDWGVDLGIIFQHIDDLLDEGLLYKKLGEAGLRARCRELAADLVERSSAFWDASATEGLVNYFLERQM